MTRTLIILCSLAIAIACNSPDDRDPVDATSSSVVPWISTISVDGNPVFEDVNNPMAPRYHNYLPTGTATCLPYFRYAWSSNASVVRVTSPAPLVSGSIHDVEGSPLNVTLDSGRWGLRGGKVTVETMEPRLVVLKFEGGTWCEVTSDTCTPAPLIVSRNTAQDDSPDLSHRCFETALTDPVENWPGAGVPCYGEGELVDCEED